MGQVVRSDPVPVLAGEHQAQVDPGVVPRFAVEVLLASVVAQGSDGHRVERDGSGTAAGLGRNEGQTTAGVHELLPNGEQMSVKVDVAPAQPEWGWIVRLVAGARPPIGEAVGAYRLEGVFDALCD